MYFCLFAFEWTVNYERKPLSGELLHVTVSATIQKYLYAQL